MRKRFFLLPVLLSGCSSIWGPAGVMLDGGPQGDATMNNTAVQTCRDFRPGKLGLAGCPGRVLDGKYAQAGYEAHLATSGGQGATGGQGGAGGLDLPL